jgi:hypothetical protein
VHEKIGHTLRLCLARILRDSLGIQRGHVHVETAARLYDVAHHHAHQQRQSGNDLKVQERLSANPADFLQILHAGDAGNDGAKDDQRDNHRDQLDERVAQRFHGNGFRRTEIAKANRKHHGE